MQEGKLEKAPILCRISAVGSPSFYLTGSLSRSVACFVAPAGEVKAPEVEALVEPPVVKY